MSRKMIAAGFFTFLLVFNSVVQFSCSKTATPEPVSKFEILTSNKWKVKALYFRDSNEPVSANVAAIYFTFKPCEEDDVYIFNKDSTFSRIDSLIKCDPQDLDPFHINIFGPFGNSRWRADAAYSEIRITLSPFYNYTWKVLVLNESEFSVENTQSDVFGDEHIYTYVFKPEGK